MRRRAAMMIHTDDTADFVSKLELEGNGRKRYASGEAVPVQNLVRVTKRENCVTATRDARVADSDRARVAVGV
jgi:hypothetical protein